MLVCPSIPVLSQYLLDGGQAKSTTISQEGFDFIYFFFHTDAQFQCPSSKSITIRENTSSTCLNAVLNMDRHQLMCNDFLNLGLKSKKEGEGEASFHSNSTREVFESCQQEKCMLESCSTLLGN